MACLVMFSGPALAQIDEQLISILVGQGQFDLAQQELNASASTATDQLFLDALIYKVQGQYVLAIKTLRTLLQQEPDRINAKRELAHTLMLSGQYSAAKKYYKTLLATEKNQQMMDSYREFMATIEQQKPFGLSGAINILSSTNLNRGTLNTTFDTTLGQLAIDQSSKAESGYGIQLTGSGFFRRIIDQQKKVILNWGITKNQPDYPHSSSTAILYI